MSAQPPARRGRERTGHRRRRAARRVALDILYQADLTGQGPRRVLEDWLGAGRPVPPYAAEIVQGVQSELDRIDRLLGENSEGWTVHRMAVVDRSILRAACWEILSGLSPAVAINEAVQTANELSTEDSGRFINGLLGRIARNARGEPETETAPQP